MAQSIKLGNDLYISEYGVADDSTNLHTKMNINTAWAGTGITAGGSVPLSRTGKILILVLSNQANSSSNRSIAFAMGASGAYYLPVSYANTPATIRYEIANNNFNLLYVSNNNMYLHAIYTLI